MRYVELPEEMRVTVARVGRETHVATVTGELDLAVAADLRERLWPFAQEDTRTLIVDLSGVTFVDSTSLGAIAATAQQLRSHGGELVVATDDPRLRHLLEITGLLGVLRLEQTLAAAVGGAVDGRGR